jgi:hypothetical protein
VGPHPTSVDVERLAKRVVFRAPDFCISVDDSATWLRTLVIQELIDAARQLGATQFTLEYNGLPIRRHPTRIAPEKIDHLLMASYSFDLIQINIF